VNLHGGEDASGSEVTVSGWRIIITPFARLNVANLSPKDNNIFWLHAVWVWAFVMYALWLLRMHYEVLPLLAMACSAPCKDV
jgi:hypothetical protein